MGFISGIAETVMLSHCRGGRLGGRGTLHWWAQSRPCCRVGPGSLGARPALPRLWVLDPCGRGAALVVATVAEFISSWDQISNDKYIELFLCARYFTCIILFNSYRSLGLQLLLLFPFPDENWDRFTKVEWVARSRVGTLGDNWVLENFGCGKDTF